MKVSILVTFYNQKQFVDECLTSLVNIKDIDYEVLVGDDGSDDGTYEVIKKYELEYPNLIKLFKMPRNPKVKYDVVHRASMNRLNLLEHSNGDFFCILDGDDFFIDENFIKKALKIFEINLQVSVIMFNHTYFNGKYFYEEHKLPSKFNGRVIESNVYLEKYYQPAGACVFRKNFNQERIDFLKNVGYFDDNDIVINSLNYGDLYYINLPVYAYRQSGESLYTSLNKLEKAVLNVVAYYANLKLAKPVFHRALLARNVHNLICVFLYRKKIKRLINTEMHTNSKHSNANYSSLLYKLINYDILNKYDKQQVNELIMECIEVKPIYFIKELLLFVLNKGS